MAVRVFDTSSSKWVRVEDGDVNYVVDEMEATEFGLSGLVSAQGFFPDFRTYRRSFRAVPVSGNGQPPHECGTVEAYIAERKDVSDFATHGF